MFYGANRSIVLGPGSSSPFQKCLNPPQVLSLVTLEEICFLFLHYFYSNFQHYYLNDENYNIMHNVLIKEKNEENGEPRVKIPFTIQKVGRSTNSPTTTTA